MTLWSLLQQPILGAVRRTGEAAQRSLKLASASLGMGAHCAHAQAPALLEKITATARTAIAAVALTLGVAGTASAVTPAGTDIVNVASASYRVSGTTVTMTASATIKTSSKTPATIEFMEYVGGLVGVPSNLVTPLNVSSTQCNKSGSGYTTLAAPTPPGQATLALPSVQPLANANLYASGDVVFVRVTDYDQNLNPLVAEIIDVTVTSGGGDSEVLRLTETGPSTGVFLGYIPSAAGTAVPGDCVFNIGGNQKLTALYIDQSESSIAITAAALVDPLGVVFDSVTGKPVDGAEVTLINVATGLPAKVFGNDGVSSYPSKVVTGSTVTDGGGTRYAFGSGRYQFPRIAPGQYRLAVAPPVGYAAPSTATAGDIRTRFGTTTFVIVVGSYGEVFQVLPGPALEIDIPVDPSDTSNVSITKAAGKSTVAVGEFVPYTLTVRNGSKSAITGVHVADKLPPGFRYQAGSARLDGVALADPTISADGRELNFLIGTLPGSGSDHPLLTLNYVALVGASAPMGTADNVAWVAGLTSNVAHASVLVRDDLNRERIILAGRVTVVDSCRDDEKDDKTTLPVALSDVRVMLQDGTYVLTDKEGRWHIDNLRAGTHVVQIDETTMPQDFEYEACEQNTRTGGRNFSQFVNVRPGSLWRADFRYMKVASCLRQSIQVQGKTVQIDLEAPVANQGVNATIMFPGVNLVAGSVMLDGKPLAQAEGGDNYLVVRLGRHAKRWTHRLVFELDAVPRADITVAMQLQPNNQPSQRLRSLVWKAGTVPATEQCAPIALPDPVAAAAAAKAEAEAKAEAQTQSARAQLQLIEQLPYDDKWVAGAAPGIEWLHPQTGFAPALPLIKIAIKHGPKDVVELKVNGALVNPIRFEGSVSNPANTVALSNWRAVDLRDGANGMDVTVRDPEGKVLFQEHRDIHYTVSPAKGVFDATKSNLVADGRTPPVIAVRMLDRLDKPVRRGAGGEFSLAAPYQTMSQTEGLQREALTGNLGGKTRYEIGEDGVALIRLQPTTQAGEVVLNFDFGGGKFQEIRVWLTPDLREWVLVGFAQGTLSHKSLSGNMENLGNAQVDSQLFDRDRVAFYAKGQVKGEYLLTAAYDSAKERGSAGGQVLRQAVDPAKYYTLYADATQAQFDAASTSKLYLKIEKSQFYALFGDYDTGLTVTELGRYSRTLNGAKTEYKGDKVSYNAFASLTSQSYHKDEIQGQGISGLYRLSTRNVLVNSDKISIETRDRLHPETILKTQDYTRYLDYQIDYTEGTVFFREPILAMDNALNPVYIVAEYESDDKTAAKLTYGGRVATKVGEKSEVGLTHVHEGNVGRTATLTAADATVPLNETTKLHAEVAQSSRNETTGPSSGSAYIVELTHNDKTNSGRVYARAQDVGFGLGQQSSSAIGTRKIGAEGQTQLSETTQVQGTIYRENKETLDAQRAEREVVEAKVQWTKDEVKTYLGGRLARETDTTGVDNEVRQVLAGASTQVLDKQLTLRVSAEIDAGSRSTGTTTGSTVYPNRLLLGADYRLTPQTTLQAAHEIAWDKPLKVNVTRVGLRTQPWQGAELASMVGSEAGTDGGRLYSDMGLVQKLQLDEFWTADFGLSRVTTLRGTSPSTLNLLPSTTSTTTTDGNGDYTAVYGGAAYKEKDWGANGRLEWRVGDTSTKVNVLLGAQRSLSAGRSMAGSLIYNVVHSDVDTSKLDVRLSYAYRPLDPKSQEWMWLDRLEYVSETQQSLASRLLTRKLINNFNANWQPDRQTQVALQYSAKYVFDTIDQTAYKGFTDLMGVEARYDLTRCWDVGVNASMLHAWKDGSRHYQIGASVGYKVTDNVWLAVGYNQLGFNDPDFSGAQYRAKGVYVSLRAKFDQDTFDLNNRRPTAPAVSIQP